MNAGIEPAYEAAAHAVSSAVDLETLVRPLLRALQTASGYDSTWLGMIRWADQTQEIVYAHNARELHVPEGLIVDWRQTLARRSLRGGPTVVTDISEIWADNDAAAVFGVKGLANVPVTLPDGSTVAMLCGASKNPVDAASLHELFTLFAVLIAQAISQQSALEQERARASAAESRLRDRLAAIAAAEHMLKTPLTVLQGWATLFERRGDALSAEQRAEGLSAIGRNAAGLRELVDRMLAATRADYRFESTVHLTLAELAPLLASVVTGHEGAAVDQTWTATLDSEVFARVDLASFEQLVSHLLDNAGKYGGPGASIDVRLTASPDGGAVVRIADTGPGMPADLPLFEPFSRSGAAERRDSVGIGLHVVKTLVDAHGAAVEFSSNAPHGTVVTLTFPAA